MPSNTAAWLSVPHGSLEVKPAPYTPPAENQLVIKTHAIAINPVDWVIPLMNPFPWVTYPTILGSDVAGEVTEVGPGVTRFKVGDRVLGHALGLTKGSVSNVEEGFQHYVVLQAHMASEIPDTLSYESASVLPLGISTAACGLFMKDYLALQHPSANPKPTGKTLLVWGGATSVGTNAIQLAVAAGYEVITTASPSNFDYVKKLGAAQVYDYHSENITEELVDAFKRKDCAGAYAIAGVDPVANQKVSAACFEVVARSEGTKFVATAIPPPEKIPEGVGTKFVFGSDLKDNEVGPAIYVEFLPKALAQGKYICAPEPLVVGKGLESLQEAFEIQKKGVSAKKVVVLL